MGPRLRKLVLFAHVVSSVGWVGAVVAYLALVGAALTSADAQTVRAAFLAMEVTFLALVPLALAALLTGVVQSLGTTWGLLRHYWVLFSRANRVSTVVLLLHIPSVTSLAQIAARPTVAVFPTGAASSSTPGSGW